MVYVGINIAKTNHYASIVNYSTDEVIESPFLVTNNKKGFDFFILKLKILKNKLVTLLKKATMLLLQFQVLVT